MRVVLKRWAECIPEPLGRLVRFVPYSWRLGRQYTLTQSTYDDFQRLDDDSRKRIIFARFKRIVEFAAHRNHFYREFYKRKRFAPEQLVSFEDIRRVPVVTKDDLLACDLELRSTPGPGSLLVNTGGTSGTPLAFYLDRHAFAREWAHMHAVWSRVGYRPTDLKLTFRGKNLGNDSLRYNAVHNEFYVNGYKDLDSVANDALRLARRRHIDYLHGYPSSIYSFTLHCIANYPDLVALLRRDLKGILFGSEFPASQYRDVVEDAFGVPTVSWYGHSEMAVLAYEAGEKYVYEPMHSYGYCEAVKIDDRYHLLGTSFDNTASPFIRYDTGDIVLPEIQGQLLTQFRIVEGRVGDFVLDRSGQRISLTALIFGRHHKVFAKAKFLQVCQERPGDATILVTLAPGVSPKAIDWAQEFDSSNVDISIRFRILPEPVTTPVGKVPLLVRPTMLK